MLQLKGDSVKYKARGLCRRCSLPNGFVGDLPCHKTSVGKRGTSRPWCTCPPYRSEEPSMPKDAEMDEAGENGNTSEAKTSQEAAILWPCKRCGVYLTKDRFKANKNNVMMPMLGCIDCNAFLEDKGGRKSSKVKRSIEVDNENQNVDEEADNREKKIKKGEKQKNDQEGATPNDAVVAPTDEDKMMRRCALLGEIMKHVVDKGGRMQDFATAVDIVCSVQPILVKYSCSLEDLVRVLRAFGSV